MLGQLVYGIVTFRTVDSEEVELRKVRMSPASKLGKHGLQWNLGNGDIVCHACHLIAMSNLTRCVGLRSTVNTEKL